MKFFLVSLMSISVMSSVFAQSLPSKPLPEVCRASKEFVQTVGSRTVHWSDLDHHRCVYRQVQNSIPTSTFEELCKEAVRAAGFDGTGFTKCVGGKKPVTIRIGCDFPEATSWTQVFQVRYTLSPNEVEANKCKAIAECLETRLTNRKEIKLAHEWYQFLKCE